MSAASPEPGTGEYIPFEEFRQGLPRGRFHVIVNPELAPKFVAFRTHAKALALALIGPGIALALYGYPWWGAALVLAAVLLRRTVKRQAGPLLLHMASRLPSVYEQATAHGVMEVRRV